jgi:hypothetical protein
VLGALQGDSPRAFSWAAALYALPLLRNGLEQDWWSLSLLLLGAVHMQARVCVCVCLRVSACMHACMHALVPVLCMHVSPSRCHTSACGH